MSIFDNYDEEYFHKKFKCETPNVLPLYFEHKLANEFGGYQFIKDIVDVPISRAVIEKFISDLQQ
jgi:hypothetical protein